MADEDRPNLPLRRLEIVFVPGVDGGFDVWNLRSNDTRRHRLEVQTDWRWLLRDANGHSYSPCRQLELKPETPDYRFWPSEAALDRQIGLIHTAGGDWLKALLPWTPLLVIANTQDDRNTKRRAILALLFAGVISTDNPPPDLRFALFQLRRLAYESLADLCESEPAHRAEMESALRRSLYAWQEEIVKAERSAFFGLGFPTVFLDQPHPQSKDRPRSRCEYGVENPSQTLYRREGAMLDLLTKGDEKRRLRAIFRDSLRGREAARTLIQRWFLPHYDMEMAESLKYAAHDAASDAQNGGRLTGWPKLAMLAHWAHWLTLLLGGVYFALSSWPVHEMLDGRVFVWLTGAVYLLGLGQATHWAFGGWPDTSLPRLRAGMLLAVIGTLLQQNWDNLLNFAFTHLGAMLLVCLALLLAAYQVLTAKIGVALDWHRGDGVQGGLLPWLRDLVGQRSTLPHRRGRPVLLRSLSSAFLFSLLLVDWLGSSYVSSPPAPAGNGWFALSLPGMWGNTYPSLVLLFTAILLFAGIFGQLLWDEKPLTEAVA